MMEYQAPWWRSFGDKAQERGVVRLAVSLVVSIVIITAVVSSCVEGIDKTLALDEQAAQRSQAMAAEFHQQVAFFDRHGSSDPATMAAAVLTTQPDNRPLVAAVAVAESNGHPQAVGDGGRSKGAWQVQARHWGRVPQDAAAQARQAEQVLMELVAAVEQRGVLRWRTALAQYNGGVSPPGVSYYYADRVLMLAWQNAIGGML